MAPPIDWISTYRNLLGHAVCLDIETTGWNGPIAVVGLYRPKEGLISVTQLVRDQTLTPQALKDGLAGVKLIITFNGNKHDLPRIDKEFPGVIPPNAISLDLFEVAASLNMRAGLKLLEGQFGIDREELWMKRRYVAVRLWRTFAEKGVENALKSLLRYNWDDTVNLYFVARGLIAEAEKLHPALAHKKEPGWLPSFAF